MNAFARESLRQRADYTHKFNAKTGRHGWLRLTPAYSVKVVEELMGQRERPLRVLDPFCGMATTALSAAYHGYEGVTTDINPFLIWLGKAKTAQYSDSSIAATRDACARAVEVVERNAVEPVKAPPIHNIERWWCPDTLEFLCALRAGIESESKEASSERNLLLVAFCRTLIELSNAAFNHQSMSFKDKQQSRTPLNVDMKQVFDENLDFVLKGAKEDPEGRGRVIFGDAKKLPETIKGSFDLVITSPPYANRMSYVRELRPYMYWLSFLKNGRDAGEIDWSTIGGTWGIATSRLADWKRSPWSFEHPLLDSALDRIACHHNKNGEILATYVAK